MNGEVFSLLFRRECSIRLKNNSTTSVVRIDAELCSEKYQGLVLDIIWQKVFKQSNFQSDKSYHSVFNNIG